jgi:hypothetical protein
MANSNGWGDGAANNTIGWGQGANNLVGWGAIYAVSEAGLTDIIGVTATAPVNTLIPSVSGSGYVGDLLTTTDGTWTGTPTSFSYQWKRGATNIGTNANTYTLVIADANTNITCVVTATNASGSTPATSNIFLTLGLFAPANINPPTIDAFISYYVGDTLVLEVNSNTWDGNEAPVLTYQWYNDNGAITNATSDSYLTVGADQYLYVYVEVTATNSQGASSINSNAVTIN